MTYLKSKLNQLQAYQNNLLTNQTFWINGGVSTYSAPAGPGIILTSSGGTATLDGVSKTLAAGMVLLTYNNTATNITGYTQGCSLGSTSSPLCIPVYSSQTSSTYSMPTNGSNNWTLAGPGLLLAVGYDVNCSQTGGTDTSGGSTMTITYNGSTLFYTSQGKGGGTGSGYSISLSWASMLKWTGNINLSLAYWRGSNGNMNVNSNIYLTYVLL